ncbi:MAG: MOSC domain-containing protein [Myxococcota bacterium]|nr:MOSC domain-containing protein [Myxococcota bacterium]
MDLETPLITRLLSINVGLPRRLELGGRTVESGILKAPVSGPRNLGPRGLAGDGQADLSAHGGIHKAVYAYSFANLLHWRREYPEATFDFATLGENLSLEDMSEQSVRIGDRFRAGDALLEVTQPREPCQKLGLKLGLPGFAKRFLASGRVGFYLSVLEPGTLSPGDPFSRVATDPRSPTVDQLNRCYHFERDDRETAERALACAALSPAWRKPLEKRLGSSA